MTPLARYQQDLQLGGLHVDAAQAEAVQYLQRVYDDLLLVQKRRTRFVYRICQRLFSIKPKPTKGLYLWGGVGIGKTYLMDAFYQSLPMKNKLRLHFHQFMREVHQQLRALQGQVNPLEYVAKYYAEKTCIICFDEFLVWDLADAMILGRLFDALFAEGVSLVATSNVKPDNLYENGLQRQLFLPTIALLKQHCQIFHVATEMDYRLRSLQAAGVYFYPLNDAAASNMQDAFNGFCRSVAERSAILTIENRQIATLYAASKVVWFDFYQLCTVPRSQVDYLEIARRYHTVLVSNVPKIGAKDTNYARYLINLVDVFYDTCVKLVLSAQVSIDDLYDESASLGFEFRRTKSRLKEMQSEEYWSQAHLPPAAEQ